MPPALLQQDMHASYLQRLERSTHAVGGIGVFWLCRSQPLRVTPPCMPLRSQHRVSCGQSLRVEPAKASVADWIHHMLKCEFFTSCPRHRDQKKAEVSAMVV